MMGDSDPAFYEAASEAVQQIRPPKGLTLEELHEFWVWVEAYAYYEGIRCLGVQRMILSRENHRWPASGTLDGNPS